MSTMKEEVDEYFTTDKYIGEDMKIYQSMCCEIMSIIDKNLEGKSVNRCSALLLTTIPKVMSVVVLSLGLLEDDTKRFLNTIVEFTLKNIEEEKTSEVKH